MLRYLIATVLGRIVMQNSIASRTTVFRTLVNWAHSYSSAPFHRDEYSFQDYGPALYLGIVLRLEAPGVSFAEIIESQRDRYETIRLGSPLTWAEAKVIACEAWEKGHPAVDLGQADFRTAV